METGKLKKFAQFARRSLIEQVSTKLKLLLADESAARREHPAAVKKLDEAIKKHSKEQVIERVAYIWFNRFCALRFMDVNRYNRVNVVSPADPGQFQPEILAEAKMGHIDEEMVPKKARQQIFALLDGKAPSRDPQGEAYRLLVVAACNFWNKAMPFLFQRIDDYTELLMPDDLLSGNSILAYTREAMTPDACGAGSNQLSVISNQQENTDDCMLRADSSAAAGGVEVIGWLYQFYISEKKDEVFDGLKKNKKITPENIPAATQLFTPHWIVRYLVENSLGRLWMLNRPNSPLKERMPYFITTEHTENTEGEKQNNKNSVSSVCSVVEKDYLVVNSPEEIKICDPACGSGHMLTYAFDLLYAIYEEEGYEPSEIPEKILTHNLYGIEIDERAGELAAFALTMKARDKQRRFFNKGVNPNICVLENVHFDEGELKNYMDFVGRDLFTVSLQTTLRQFEEADNFGSLIRPDVTDVDAMLKILESKNVSGQLFISMTHQKVLQALRQADYLSPKYHVVIANPPYMGGKGMNVRLGTWLKDNYEDVKSDLFSAFVVRNTGLTLPKGQLGFMTPFVWMFISSYEKLRSFLINLKTLTSLVQLEYSGFDGATVPICTFTIENAHNQNFKGGYVRLSDFRGSENQGPRTLEAIKNPNCGWFYRASAADFKKIPGSPIAYWASENEKNAFRGRYIIDELNIKSGLLTGKDELFLRTWFEVPYGEIPFHLNNSSQIKKINPKWLPVTGGGNFRKWYGNLQSVVNSYNYFYAIKNLKGNNYRLRDDELYFKKAINWPMISSAYYGAKLSPENVVLGNGVRTGFVKDFDKTSVEFFVSYLSSKVANNFLKIINPTLNYNNENIEVIPLNFIYDKNIHENGHINISISKSDWNSYETSWDFTSLPLLNPDHRQPTLKATYQKLRAHWQEMTLEMQRLEEENNRIFIEAYGLQDELKPDVPLNEITLTCNPYYRYNRKTTTGNQTTEHTEYTEKEKQKDKNSVSSVCSVVKKSFPIDDELEALLLADTMRELISYAVGCMFGRYSLNKPGLILANQGETIEDYHRKIGTTCNQTTEHTEYTENKKTTPSVSSVYSVVKNSFPPDEDNVIPMLDGDWFTDDISGRFKQFLKVAFGVEHYEENLRFVEASLNIKGKRNYSIRDYFLAEFYSDHLKRYKKRPIYWLFSSPKGSFNALIYMHRYRPDTVSVVLNDYLREFRTKLTSHKNHLEAVSISASASQAEKTKALKEIEKITRMIAELEEYEREVLYPLATEQVEIDLDDGVKANYPKFGAALKKIVGLDAKEE